MGLLADLIPFHPGRARRLPRRPKFDVARALGVRLHAHPTLQQHRADNGELVLVVERPYFPGERFIARFFTVRRIRRVVLDRYGEFMLTRALEPGTTLAEVADRLTQEFDVEPEKARLGVIQMVRELLLRGFVFLVQGNSPS